MVMEERRHISRSEMNEVWGWELPLCGGSYIRLHDIFLAVLSYMKEEIKQCGPDLEQ